MHPPRGLSACLLASVVAVACDQQQTTPVAGGVGPAADAGTVPPADAGTPPATDAGTPPGPDAGTGGGDGGGTPDAGTGGTADGGTTASDCDGLAPASIGTVQTWSVIFDGINGRCGLAASSGDGVIAQLKTDMASHPAWVFINTQTGMEQSAYSVWHGDIFAQPLSPAAPFYGYVDEGAQRFHLAGIDDATGASRAVTPSLQLYADEPIWDAGDPSGGMVLAGPIALDGQPNRRRVMTSRGTFGPRDLARDAPIFGIGVDLAFHTLVIQAGDCGGCVSAQWFDGDGQSPTGSFTLITGFVPGHSTWFETAPLIGGGLAVRRVDANDTGDPYPYKSTWLVTIAAGSTSAQPAPGWLTSRPDTDIALVRNRTAYAVLPNGATESACTQRLELVSPGGNSCAHWDLDLPAATCTTSELRVGYDGTILQHTPTELERNPYGRPQSCTLRYWPAALR